MNTKLTLTVLMLLFALALPGCVGYATDGSKHATGCPPAWRVAPQGQDFTF